METNKKYNIIYADPPWSYNDKKCLGGAEKIYSCMSLNDICNLSVPDICADNCILFLWATYPMIREALQVIDAWGFTYKTIGFNWIKLSSTGNKLSFGLGRYTRGNSEPLFIGVKGKINCICHNMNEVLCVPNLRHSEKPDVFRRKIVELVGDLPRCELFARTKPDGWDVWGNEVKCDFNLTVNKEEGRD